MGKDREVKDCSMAIALIPLSQIYQQSNQAELDYVMLLREVYREKLLSQNTLQTWSQFYRKTPL